MTARVRGLGAPGRRDHARSTGLEVSIDFDSRDAKPLKFEKLVDRDTAPLVKSESGHITESDAFLWIVLSDIPGAGSGDIEELGNETRIFG
jgi:hypothetical protein